MSSGALAGKVALVSGSGRGIGSAIARKLAEVIEVDRNPASAILIKSGEAGGGNLGRRRLLSKCKS